MRNFSLTNTVQDDYSFDLGNIAGLGTAAVWSINFPPGTTQTKKYLQISYASHFQLGHLETDFPTCYTINSTICGGYTDQNGIATNILAYIYPEQINSTQNSNLNTYNIKYKTIDSPLWQIGLANNVTLTLNKVTSGGSQPVLCGGTTFPVHIKVIKLNK